MSNEIILQVTGLKRHFIVRRSWLGRALKTVPAVDGVSLSIRRGTVVFEGENVLAARGADLKQFRRKVQTIFQDPFASLNPRRTIGDGRPNLKLWFAGDDAAPTS